MLFGKYRLQELHIPCLAISLFLIFLLAACGDSQQSPAPGAPEVEVAKPLKKSVTIWDEYTGRFTAVENVQLRSRLTGYLVEKKFTDGAIVKKGAVLFVIDPRPFEFELKRAKAKYNLSVKEYKRAHNLIKAQAISQDDFDRLAQEIKVSEANLDEAKMNLDFTQIKAPFDGRVSDSFVDVGNLVSANNTVLTTIVSLNPIHFEFEISQGDLLRYTRLGHAGKRPKTHETQIPIFVKLQDEERFDHIGVTDFIDNTVGQSTGTIRARALIENNNLSICPGLFGRAQLVGEFEDEYIVLPERALNTDQNRKFVYVINSENKANRAYVEVGRLLDNGFVVIDKGLTGDELVVINGIQRIRLPEQPVTPKIIELNWTEIEHQLSKQSLMNKLSHESTSQEMNDNLGKGSIEKGI